MVQCEQFVEDNEDNISEWYFSEVQLAGLQESLCPAILDDASCLSEPYGELVPSPKEETPANTNRKGETAKNIEL